MTQYDDLINKVRIFAGLRAMGDPCAFGEDAALFCQAADALAALIAENERLQRIIDSRPAINAALPESYIAWSQSIYLMESLTGSKENA